MHRNKQRFAVDNGKLSSFQNRESSFVSFLVVIKTFNACLFLDCLWSIDQSVTSQYYATIIQLLKMGVVRMCIS